jgi:hypothetical protein
VPASAWNDKTYLLTGLPGCAERLDGAVGVTAQDRNALAPLNLLLLA